MQVMPLSNVKEEIYAALDEWVAFEVEFPIIAVGKALKELKHQDQWQRIIQVLFFYGCQGSDI